MRTKRTRWFSNVHLLLAIFALTLVPTRATSEKPDKGPFDEAIELSKIEEEVKEVPQPPPNEIELVDEDDTSPESQPEPQPPPKDEIDHEEGEVENKDSEEKTFDVVLTEDAKSAAGSESEDGPSLEHSGISGRIAGEVSEKYVRYGELSFVINGRDRGLPAHII